jgi:serine/threonine-protein kinase
VKKCETCGAGYEGALDRCPLDRGRLVEAADPLVGRLVRGVYRILAPIGRGSLATVYRARHEVVGRDVAIKVLSAGVSRSPTLRERFLREARAANRIRHPHVIDISDIGETEDGLAFLVMELLDGGTLAQEIAGGPLAPGRALAIAAQAASALGRAHDLGVVHRDVKPANIVLRRGGDPAYVVLLDFGLANVRGEHRLTASGELFGTPAYMAPEQIEGAPPTPAVDLYALGCVLFEMLTGSLPFQGSTPATLEQHLRAPPPRPSERRAALSPEIDALVLALLAKDPAARTDARGLEDALRALVAPAPAAEATSRTPALPWEQIGAFADRLGAIQALRDELASAGPARARELTPALARALDALVHAGPALIEALRRSREALGDEGADEAPRAR